MDFEEQLEKAEKSPYPSLVGASVKSADDSPHNNYIHPEKYTGASKTKPGKKSILNTSIGASLDDLISEGALLGSDEDFDRFLDDKGNVLSDAKYSKEKDNAVDSTKPVDEHKPVHGSSLRHIGSTLVEDDSAVLSPVDSVASGAPPSNADAKTSSNAGIYSTPNLSEYQIGHQISDHSQLLDSVKSYDLSKLPTSDDNESRSKRNEVHPAVENNNNHKPARPSNLRANSWFTSNKLEVGENAQVSESDSLHTPYFQSDERPTSRSRSRVAFCDDSRERSRSRSTSVMAPHLARGDSYKNTHEETPSKYELPAGMKLDEDDEEPDDRRSRQSKPTLGDSIAAAEAVKQAPSDTESVTRDPSLVTSGDYTNFNADGHDHVLKGSNLYSLRSESSTNYLRSISRSRSRKPANDVGSQAINEKNDADPQELEREGALVSDDPYSQVDDLDNMMKKVLKGSAQNSPSKSKNLVNDVSAKTKSTETKEQFKESTPAVSVDAADVGDATKQDSDSKLETKTAEDVLDKSETGSEKPGSSAEGKNPSQERTAVNDVSAEEKDIETKEQVVAEKAPTVSASDIHVGSAKAPQHESSVTYASKSSEASEVAEGHVNDISAEKKEEEAREQLKADDAPTVSASDIHVKSKATDDVLKGNTETIDAVKAEIGEKQVGPEQTRKDSKDESSDDNASASTAKECHVDEAHQKVSPSEKAQSGDKHHESVKEDHASTEKPRELTSSAAGIDSSDKDEEKSSNPEESSVLEPQAVQEKKEISEGTSDKNIEVAEKPSNLIVEPDNISADPASIVPKATAKEVEPEAKAVPESKGVPEPNAAHAKEEEEDFDVSPEELRKHLESLPVYLYTSLAGGMQIITRTNRLATILQANGVKFEYKDLGTDEEAKKLWRRYAQGKTLPGVVRGDDFIGNWEYIEEVNEDYRLKEVLHETL